MNHRIRDSISKNDFSIYLHDIQNEYITFDSNLSSPKNSTSVIDDEVSRSSSVDEKELREDLIKCRRNVSISYSLSLSLQTQSQTQQVPEEFFDEGFDLTRPQMFRKVVTFERLSKEDEERPPDLVLHERLTSYLDSVEVCLLKQISSKANTFFAALKNLRNFKNEVNESCAKMRTLRGIVRLLKQSLVIDLAKVPQNRIRRRNLERLSHTVALMTEVRSTKKTVQSLLEVGDYHSSLNLIDRVQSVLKEELSGLMCMRHLSRQLLKFQNLIRDTMCDRFLELAVSLDLSRHTTSHDDDQDEDDSEQDQEEDRTRRIRQRLELKEKLLPLVRGLLRIGHLQNLISKYRTRVSELLTRVIKTSVSASLNETELLVAAAASELNTKDEEAKDFNNNNTNVKSVSVVTQLRSLGPQGFMSLLEVVLEHLSIVTSRASEIHRTLMSVLLDCGPAANLSKDLGEDQSNKSAKTLKAKLEQEGCERTSFSMFTRHNQPHLKQHTHRRIKRSPGIRLETCTTTCQ